MNITPINYNQKQSFGIRNVRVAESANSISKIIDEIRPALHKIGGDEIDLVFLKQNPNSDVITAIARAEIIGTRPAAEGQIPYTDKAVADVVGVIRNGQDAIKMAQRANDEISTSISLHKINSNFPDKSIIKQEFNA